MKPKPTTWQDVDDSLERIRRDDAALMDRGPYNPTWDRPWIILSIWPAILIMLYVIDRLWG